MLARLEVLAKLCVTGIWNIGERSHTHALLNMPQNSTITNIANFLCDKYVLHGRHMRYCLLQESDFKFLF